MSHRLCHLTHFPLLSFIRHANNTHKTQSLYNSQQFYPLPYSLSHHYIDSRETHNVHASQKKTNERFQKVRERQDFPRPSLSITDYKKTHQQEYQALPLIITLCYGTLSYLGKWKNIFTYPFLKLLLLFSQPRPLQTQRYSFRRRHLQVNDGIHGRVP